MKAGYAAAAVMAWATAATAQPAQDAALGRGYPAVNGETIRCAAPPARDPAQLAAQFETRPRDLDEMSKGAQRFMDPKSDFAPAVAFRQRQAEQRAVDWPYLCRYRDANAELVKASERPVAVFMGDSITEGWVEADPQFFSANRYVDRGVSGQSSSQMLARFYPDVVALKPAVVHIVAGTNDIGGATGPITADEYIFNVTAMIDLAQVNGIKVVLGAIPPMSRLLPRPDFNLRPIVRDLNGRLEALAKAKGVIFVDYYAPLAADDGAFDTAYANDGVHPTRAGYKVMEPLAKQAIDQALKR